MKEITIELSFAKALKFYESGNEELKEIALKAYTEDEFMRNFTRIKDFWDAVKALGLDKYTVHSNLDNLGSNQLISLYKLGIIRRALNGEDWNPNFECGSIYEAYVRVYKSVEDIEEDEEIIERFVSNGETYFLVGGCSDPNDDGLCSFDEESNGFSNPGSGLFGCKSGEIAEYMSLKFGKLIFDACYSQYNGLYEWL